MYAFIVKLVEEKYLLYLAQDTFLFHLCVAIIKLSVYLVEVKGSTWTQGARALAKHANRGSNGYWGIFNGSG